MDEENLKNLKGLMEMYVSSMILNKEFIDPLRRYLPDKTIRKRLSEETGKDINSIYRDERTGTIYNGIMFLRYWRAFLVIHNEVALDASDPKRIESILQKYEIHIKMISEIEGEVDFQSAIGRHLSCILDVIQHFERYPLPQNRKAKINVLKKLQLNEQVMTGLKQRRRERMTSID
ncbi:hypothetical protein [Exiguobacterium artemiae]|uniref:hypothetical protein n=1 Tax=Exiguobacterium artemiae TaxID=340145 RepID=UPI002964AF19|nr:hypothetical protein [Exiguobacterium sibiricum]MDW2886666.1 hypothetical protein [Exiguobacterium sibiricum]